MLGKLFAPLAMKVCGALIVAQLLALGVAMWRADAISADRDRLRDRLAGSEANHAVTRASLAGLELQLAAMVAEGAARRERVVAALSAARDDGLLLRDQAEEIRAAIIADPCVTPAEIMRGGL